MILGATLGAGCGRFDVEARLDAATDYPAIGAADLAESVVFAGAIDEVAGYAAELPAPRVQAHYRAP